MRSRKTLIYLILTLNHIYPDYDFSLLRAHHFRKELGVKALEESVDSYLLEVSRVCCRDTQSCFIPGTVQLSQAELEGFVSDRVGCWQSCGLECCNNSGPLCDARARCEGLRLRLNLFQRTVGC